MTRQYFTVVPAVYILFRRNDEILLLKRANTSYMDGFYSLPAGHVDGGEPAAVAAIREAREEVAVNLQSDDLQLVHTLHRRTQPGDKGGLHERIDLFFEVSTWDVEPTNNEPGKCSELRWAPMSGLPPEVVPEVRYALAAIIAGKPYSDYNFQVKS